MGEKIVVGPINSGLRTDRTPFVIDNDSFPAIINAYQWRGRVKRKRGTSLLGRLDRYFSSTSTSYSSTATITLSGGGAGNLVTGFSLQTNSNIVPGSVSITDTTTSIVYTDPSMDGTLSPSGSINYATGAITILAAAGHAISVVMRYYPDLPVMGLVDFTKPISQFPQSIAFDTVYAYNILNVFPYNIYSVSFYKNPASNTYVDYVRKSVSTPTTWNGQDYQQFWTTNYQGAMWETNGVSVPFSVTNVGMQYKEIDNVVITSAGPPAIVELTIMAHGLSIGDFVFINEVVGNTGINFQTGYVTNVGDVDTVTVELPNATIGGSYSSGGIAQYLTNRSDTTKDCLRWYDGDPTNGSASTPVLNGTQGWVNFAPPLSNLPYSISDLPAQQYYLVGAKLIVPFKDRLLFFGPVIQTSSAGSQIYLPDTVVYSQNGTPYYTCSFTGDPLKATTVFNPILVPTNQTATAGAYWEDQTGFGGFLQAGIDQPIISVSSNQDVLVVGFTTTQTKLVYTGNDVVPFNFFTINSELGTDSQFSTVNMDKGSLTRGNRGFIITTQVESRRIDLDIPDQVFQIKLTENGAERVCSQRDFVNEWIYFTYPSNMLNYKFPNQTLLYNYRDESWSIFNEAYTTYGSFRKQDGFTWATVGLKYNIWNDWNDPWNAGTSTLLQQEVIAGNQHGFVLVKDEGTGEGNSLYIRNITNTTVTSPSHTLNQGDYIVISGCLGTIGPFVNDKIFSVGTTTTDTFTINPLITGSGTYLGGGVIKRMYVPFIQSKQFPVAWNLARKTRLGVQQYLFTTTQSSQIQLLIYLSQNGDSPYNVGPLVPSSVSVNNSLIYSTILYTCPESTNLGLTPSNINLQMVTAEQQQQIWHRINTSLIGDTVQVAFTMSDEQMRDEDFSNQFAEIEFHAMILDCSPSMLLS